MIVRNRIYTKLKEELGRIDENPNYMTVPAAIRELEKIEMLRGTDRVYRLDHAVTKTQRTIYMRLECMCNTLKIVQIGSVNS